MAKLAEIGRQHGLSGSACPTLIAKPAYYAAFVAAWFERQELAA